MADLSDPHTRFIESLKTFEDPVPPLKLENIKINVLRVSTTKLAAILQVTRQTVTRWQKGHTECKGPYARLIWVLANYPDIQRKFEDELTRKERAAQPAPPPVFGAYPNPPHQDPR